MKAEREVKGEEKKHPRHPLFLDVKLLSRVWAVISLRKLVFLPVEIRASEKHILICGTFHYVNCTIASMLGYNHSPSVCGVPFCIDVGV